MNERRRRMPLSEDPDPRLVRRGWLAWSVATVLIAWFAWRDRAHAAEAMTSWILAAPALAWWLLWPVARGTIALWDWMRARPYAAWHGHYYEFNGRQIRILSDGDALWIVADDVFDALGLTGQARDPEHVRQIGGRDGLVKLPGSPLFAFTERGLAAWMERRTDRDAVAFKRWLGTQVIAPHRRRR